MELKDKTITELKAIKCDLMVYEQQVKNDIILVNSVIAQKIEEEKKLSELTLKPSEE